MERGQRQVQRSKQAFITALVALLRQTPYRDITIDQIAAHANLGRSTFYRHFQSKADVLVEMHKELFARAELGLLATNPEAPNLPPPGLVRMLELFKQAGALPVSLTRLGDDADYLLRQTSQLLHNAIEEQLRQLLVEAESTIPVPILAQSITGVYLWVLHGALEGQFPFAPHELATTIQRLQRALVHETLRKEDGKHE
ncbi:MAG: TetR/AcrR family transcriptional regulator [Caldilineaceae bacterium]